MPGDVRSLSNVADKQARITGTREIEILTKFWTVLRSKIDFGRQKLRLKAKFGGNVKNEVLAKFEILNPSNLI